MKLEDIGFYTLSDERAKNASESSPLHRCEILITDKCNFKCPYCRGMREDLRGTMSCVLEVLENSHNGYYAHGWEFGIDGESTMESGSI